jgi:hypothetical protein
MVRPYNCKKEKCPSDLTEVPILHILKTRNQTDFQQLLLPNTASMYVCVLPQVHSFTWPWRQQFPLICWYLSVRLHGATPPQDTCGSLPQCLQTASTPFVPETSQLQKGRQCREANAKQTRESESESELRYNWRSVSLSVLVSSPVWGSWPDICLLFDSYCIVHGRAPSLTRGWVCLVSESVYSHSQLSFIHKYTFLNDKIFSNTQ